MKIEEITIKVKIPKPIFSNMTNNEFVDYLCRDTDDLIINEEDEEDEEEHNDPPDEMDKYKEQKEKYEI